ncbi:MAG: PDZ domain-containing protein [Desulfamplus sp.]|nr:PDZ domain-containing protein [Desulfamplus sp.]
MKYIFNLFNITCLTGIMFLLVDTLYGSIGLYFLDLSHNNSSISSQFNNGLSKNRYSKEPYNSNPNLKVNPLPSHYDIIHERDIFNTAKDIAVNNNKDKDSLSEQELESLEKTELKLKLWGTATGGEDSENYAVIENDKDKKQELYKIGDKIEDAVIKKILRFSVILSRNGKDEKLEITEEETSKKSSGLISNNSSNKESSSENGESINISIKRSFIDESMKDINGLMSQVRVRPHFTGGNPDGILLYGIKQSSMFKEMGIQNGDIIMGIDGKEITSVDDAISLYDRLKNSSDLKMQIRRRGQVKELLYHVE